MDDEGRKALKRPCKDHPNSGRKALKRSCEDRVENPTSASPTAGMIKAQVGAIFKHPGREARVKGNCSREDEDEDLVQNPGSAEITRLLDLRDRLDAIFKQGRVQCVESRPYSISGTTARVAGQDSYANSSFGAPVLLPCLESSVYGYPYAYVDSAEYDPYLVGGRHKCIRGVFPPTSALTEAFKDGRSGQLKQQVAKLDGQKLHW